MTVYIVGFAISTVLMRYAYADIAYCVSGKRKICEVVALLLPCLIAGLRAESIGTDVRVYVAPIFENARYADSFLEFYQSEFFKSDTWSYDLVRDYEFGFVLLCYLSAKFFRSLPVLLFLLQALTVIPIYKGLRAFSHTQPVWLGMAVYYLLFFNQSLNMIRQWIAMAFLFYGFQFLRDRKPRKYFVMVVVAMLFHNSAVLGIAVYFVYQFTAKENTYNKALKTTLLVTIGLCSVFSLEFIIAILNWLGLRYSFYISGSLQLMPNQFLYRIPIVLLLIWRWKHLKKTDQHASFYLVMLVYDLIASQLTSIYANSGRIGLFFCEYYMLAYPALCVASYSQSNRQTIRWFVISYLCVYWWYTYVYVGSSATVPYISIWG